MGSRSRCGAEQFNFRSYLVISTQYHSTTKQQWLADGLKRTSIMQRFSTSSSALATAARTTRWSPASLFQQTPLGAYNASLLSLYVRFMAERKWL